MLSVSFHYLDLFLFEQTQMRVKQQKILKITTSLAV